jgi:hypothetical protein
LKDSAYKLFEIYLIFNFVAHILFDDAMALDDNNEFVPNEYVKLLATIMEEAAR